MPDDSIDYESGVLRVLQDKAETKAFYNKIAKVYDLLSEHSEKAMREEGIKMLAPAPGERLLEIGFGTGHVLVELAKAVGPTGNVFGTDLSENMLAHATRSAGTRKAEQASSSPMRRRREGFPMTQSPWMGSSCASRWNSLTPRQSLGYWPSAGEFCGRVGGSWSLPCRKKASKDSWCVPSSGPTGIFPT